jgi:two-component system heavy metal sensor histidine kinase CusS
LNILALGLRSLSLRLGLMLAVVGVIVFSATGYLLHTELESVLRADEETDLKAKVQVTRSIIDDVRSAADLPMLKRRLAAASMGGHYHWSVWLVDRDGRVVFGGDPVPRSIPADAQHIRIERQDGVSLRGTTYTVDDHPLLPGVRVYIGMDPRPRAIMLDRYDESSVIICILGVLVTVILTFAATRSGLRPILRLSGEAAGITPDALSRRLTLPQESSELMPLALRFNEVLDRMEQAWQQLEGFNADVAHELRTPLAIMISGAEMALSRERTLPDLREVLESHLEELRALTHMTNDMLFLAGADRGGLAENVARVSLRREALRVADFVEALIDERQQSMAIEGEAEVMANATLVCRAIVNLLTNGARHSQPGAMLTVRIAPIPGGASLEVINPGPPIPEEIQRRMFDRFWRGDSARVKIGDRFGLGLAIVRAVALMHGGHTFVRCEGGKNHVGFTLSSLRNGHHGANAAASAGAPVGAGLPNT